MNSQNKNILLIENALAGPALAYSMLEAAGYNVIVIQIENDFQRGSTDTLKAVDVIILDLTLMDKRSFGQYYAELELKFDCPIVSMVPEADVEYLKKTILIQSFGSFHKQSDEFTVLSTIQNSLILYRLVKHSANTKNSLEIRQNKSPIVADSAQKEPQVLTEQKLYKHLDKINRIMQQTDDLDKMMEFVLDEILNIFSCDRAALVYPCDPNADFWKVPMERTRAEYPGLHKLGFENPMDPIAQSFFLKTLSSKTPIKWGPAYGQKLAPAREQQGHKSMLAMAIFPEIGKPWSLNLHQCSYFRKWTDDEAKLFYEIGLRVAEALNNLLLLDNLRENERKLSEAQRLASLGSWELDLKLNLVMLSAECRRILNHTNIDAMSLTEWRTIWNMMIHEEDRDKSSLLFDTNRQSDQINEVELRIINPDHTVQCLFVSTELQTDTNNKPAKIIGTVQDITRQKETEKNLEDLNRKLRALSNCNQALIRAKEESSLLRNITQIVVNEAGYSMAWVGYLDREKQRHLTPLAWAGPDDIFFNEAPFQLSGIPDSPDPIATAIQKKEPLCIQDLSTSTIQYRFKENAVKRGFQSCIFLPLIYQSDNILGILVIYSDKKGTFTADERWLLEELADDLAFGIQSLRMRNERSQFLEEMQKSNELLRVMLETVPVAVIGMDLEGNVQQIWNKNAEKMLGWCAEEVMGKLLPTVDFDVKGDYDLFKQLVRDAVPFDGVETLRKRKDGSKIHLSIYSTPFYDSSGKVTGNLAVFLDISEKKKMEETLRESEERYRSMFNNSPLGIFRATLDGQFLELNPALAKMLGYETVKEAQREITNISNQIFVKKEDRHLLFSEHFVSDGFIHHEMDLKRRDGREFIAELYLNFICDTGNKPLFIQGIVEDITERKRNEDLMIQSEKMVSLGGLAAGIAHEINNPLGAILMGAQIIKKRLSTELPKNQKVALECGIDLKQLQEYLHQRQIYPNLEGILASGKRAGEIVVNMLQFSRRSGSKMVQTNLLQIINQAIDLAGKDYDLKKKFDFRKIRIEKNYDLSSPEMLVTCIESEIEQVILNLLKNASQAIAGSKAITEPTIKIHVHSDDEAVVIEVEDNGPGMDETTRKHIFEPFFTTKSVGEGTGLGLSVSYTIITKNHKGTMEVESKPGSGTQFIIKFPLNLKPENL